MNCFEEIGTNDHRSLLDFRNTNATYCVLSGNGTSGTSVIAFETYQIVLTAKDSSGTSIGSGGNVFIVEIYNNCTAGSNFA